MKNVKNTSEILVRGSEKGHCICDGKRDVILPDHYGDIKKILRATGTLSRRIVNTDRAGAKFEGQLSVTVLFVDESDLVRTFDTSLDVIGNCPLDLPSEDLSVISTSQVESVSVKSVNPRKIGIKASVCFDFKIWSTLDTLPQMPTFFDSRTLASVEKQCETCLYTSLAELCDQGIHVNRELELDKNMPSIGEILSFSLTPAKVDLSCGDRSIDCSTELATELVYLSDDRQVCSMQKKIPISTTIDSDKVTSETTSLGICSISSHECRPIEDMTGQYRAISVNLKCDMTVYAATNTEAQYVTDIYSTDFRTECEKQTVKFSSPASLEKVSTHRKISSPVDADGGVEILSVKGSSVVTSFVDKDDGRYCYVSSTITALVRRADGTVSSIGIPDGFEVSLPKGGEELCVALFELESADILNGDLSVSYSAELTLLCWENRSIDVVRKLSACETDRIVQGRPLTVYYPAPGETLWQVAKRYSIASDMLEAANRDRDVGGALIIPRRCAAEGA